jgi:hypothetical protein
MPSPAQLGRRAEHRGCRDGLQPDLEALASSASAAGRADIAREEPDDDDAAVPSATSVADETVSLAQVDEQGDGRVRDHGDAYHRSGTHTEPGHADPGQPAWRPRDCDIHARPVGWCHGRRDAASLSRGEHGRASAAGRREGKHELARRLGIFEHGQVPDARQDSTRACGTFSY